MQRLQTNKITVQDEAKDIDHRLTKQQYTIPLQWDLGGRKTSCIACQQKNYRIYEKPSLSRFLPFI